MRRLVLLTVALICALCLCPAPALHFGRFAQPGLTGEGTLANLSHNVVVERGFKLQYLPLQRSGEYWGAPVFAGFVSVLLEGKLPAYTLCPAEQPGQGTELVEVTPTGGRYGKVYQHRGATIRLTCQEVLGLPLARFSGTITGAATSLNPHWLMTGWSWAGQRVPGNWEWWEGGRRTRLAPEAGSGGRRVPGGQGVLLAWDDGHPYTLAFLCSAPLTWVWTGQQGVVLQTAEHSGGLPDLYVAVLSPRVDDALLALLPELARPFPRLTSRVQAGQQGGAVCFGWEGGRALPVVPVPPPFSARVSGPAAIQHTPLGPAAFVRSTRATISLPAPPRLECLVEDFLPLPPQEQDAVAADVEAILSQQQPDGQFRFSLGRPFYDGQVAGVLVQVAPLLGEPLRARTNAAVRRTLDYWWSRLAHDERTGLVHFPEPSGAVQVDYPEISATLLYPTAAYAALVQPAYARERWPQAARLAATLPACYDVTGSAWAHPGPEYVHVLTESTIGGYLAYASLYHLARLAGEKERLPELRARAAWAWAARDLYRWRPEYGRGGILSQWFAHGMFVEPALAWDYTMPTWFSWCPLWSLPEGDPYHVFTVLEQQRWWEYFHGSRQLAYDWSHFTAYMRFGKVEDGLAHYQEILAHQPSFDNFDTVALYRTLGRVWRHQREAKAGQVTALPALDGRADGGMAGGHARTRGW